MGMCGWMDGDVLRCGWGWVAGCMDGWMAGWVVAPSLRVDR